MSSLSYKPLRQSVHLTHITDEEIRWKIKNRAAAKDFLCELRSCRPQPEVQVASWKIVPEARGKIAHILLTVPGHYDQKNPEQRVDPQDEKHFTTLIRHLASHKRKFTVLCHAPQIELIQNWFRENGIASEMVQICVSVFNYSIWAQDAYIALNDAQGNIILSESICFTRDHDMSVADDLELQSDIRAHQSHIYFQGGNILETRELVLVGMDYIRENEGRPYLETQEKVVKTFSKHLGKPVMPVGRNELILHRHRQYLGGGVFQPVFHIDMYITPTGFTDTNGKELLMVGSPSLARKILNEPEEENDLDVYFDEVAAQLAGRFNIERLPLLPTQYKKRESVFPRHYYLTYNNVLTEVFTENGVSHSYVYLPTYAGSVKRCRQQDHIEMYYGSEERYRKLDEGAKKIWEAHGFIVFQMDGLEDLAMSWGAVHCMVKTLQRE